MCGCHDDGEIKFRKVDDCELCSFEDMARYDNGVDVVVVLLVQQQTTVGQWRGEVEVDSAEG